MDSTMQKRVAITGMGVISSLGDSPATLHSSLCNGKTSIYQFDESHLNGSGGKGSSRVAEFRAGSYLEGKKLRPLGGTGQLVVAGAGAAVGQRGCPSHALAAYCRRP